MAARRTSTATGTAVTLAAAALACGLPSSSVEYRVGTSAMTLGATPLSPLGATYYLRVVATRDGDAALDYPCTSSFTVCLPLSLEGVAAPIQGLCPTMNTLAPGTTGTGRWTFTYALFTNAACSTAASMTCPTISGELLAAGVNVNDIVCTPTVGPAIQIVKTASPTSVAPFQPITYSYAVTNTGSVTLTDIAVTDDNATPSSTADDFVAGTIASLAPGASQTITQVVTPALSSTAPVLLGLLNHYALFALDNGSLFVNSSTSLVGNVGISRGVDTQSAQNVTTFDGSVYLHTTAAADFYATYVAASFNPSGGIQSDATVDAQLDQANADAAALATFLDHLFASSPVTTIDGSVSQDLTSAGLFNLYDVSWSYSGDTLTLRGGPNDWFILRSTASGNTWADSRTVLDGVDPNHVLFYFTAANALDVTIRRAGTEFRGNIFAPAGQVVYRNAGQFYGRIIARNVTGNSGFAIQAPPAPTPPTLTNTATVTASAGTLTVSASATATARIDR